MRLSLSAAVLLAVSLPLAGFAQDRTYENARFGYSIAIPAGFGSGREADNGDGITLPAGAGDAELLVWGSNMLVDTFGQDVSARIAADGTEGWTVSYRRETGRWASWSGSKDGRIFYSRAIPLCDGATGFFRLEYDRSAKRAYDGIVGALVKSFRSSPCG